MIKIYIKSIKSINSGQFIGFGDKLTFLVGPNSAGKSAVLLALTKLSGEDSNFEFDQTIVHTNPNRDCEISAVSTLGVEWPEPTKKIKEEQKIGLYTSHFPIALTQKISTDLIINIHTINELSQIKAYEYENIMRSESIFFSGSHRISIYSLEATNFYLDFILQQNKSLSKKDFTSTIISLGNTDAAHAKEFADAKLWLTEIFEPSLVELDSKSKKYYETKAQDEIRKKLEDANKRHKDNLANNLIHWNKAEFTVAIKSKYKGQSRQRMLNICEKYDSLVERYKKAWFHRVKLSYPGKSFTAALVSAERTLPTDSQLNATIKYWEKSGIFQDLMDDAINAKWLAKNSASSNEKLRRNTLMLVNRALTENLFIDNGYLVEVESNLLLPREDFENYNDLDEFELDEHEFNCKIHLKDAHGRKLKFSDVGSGIGYVLPVLIESFRPSNSGKTVFLQQPELHLHPALQANLTDVLIEASADRRIVAETHSEHLILRALKRVRQTNAGTLADKNLQLTPSDIAVNYFEPLPDGSTRVHILRVSEDGDFIDRWPNGFFAERDKELFDE